MLKISAGTVGNWESARNGPNLEELERVSSVLNEPIWYLLGLDDSEGGAAWRLSDAEVPKPWDLLGEDTLRAALKDLSSDSSDRSMDLLEQVVAEIRRRSRPAPSGGGGGPPKSPKVAAALADLSSVRPGKPTT